MRQKLYGWLSNKNCKRPDILHTNDLRTYDKIRNLQKSLFIAKKISGSIGAFLAVIEHFLL